MDLILTGLSHRTAGIEEREAAALRGERLAAALASLSGLTAEGVVLSTCNRTEIYGYVEGPAAEIAPVLRTALGGANTNPEHWYTCAGPAVVEHLFGVAAGLDSLVLGEAQILGQIKQAWTAAHAAGVAGPVCSALFQRAVAAGKRVRGATAIGDLPASVSYAAVMLARQVLGGLDGRRVLVLGAGTVGEAVARCLMQNGAGTLLVANRHAERATALAAAHGEVAVPWTDLDAALRTVDIVISATDAPGFVLDAALVVRARESAALAPLHLIDLAVPRDIDPACGDLPGVLLHNIDDLRAVVDAGQAQRRQSLPEATRIVAGEVAAFMAWLDARRAAATIDALHRSAETIRQAETAWALAHLGSLSDRDRAVVEALSARLVGKLLHGPTARLRILGAAPDGDSYIAAVQDLFGLAGASAQYTPGDTA